MRATPSSARRGTGIAPKRTLSGSGIASASAAISRSSCDAGDEDPVRAGVDVALARARASRSRSRAAEPVGVDAGVDEDVAAGDGGDHRGVDLRSPSWSSRLTPATGPSRATYVGDLGRIGREPVLDVRGDVDGQVLERRHELDRGVRGLGRAVGQAERRRRRRGSSCRRRGSRRRRTSPPTRDPTRWAGRAGRRARAGRRRRSSRRPPTPPAAPAPARAPRPGSGAGPAPNGCPSSGTRDDRRRPARRASSRAPAASRAARPRAAARARRARAPRSPRRPGRAARRAVPRARARPAGSAASSTSERRRRRRARPCRGGRRRRRRARPPRPSPRVEPRAPRPGRRPGRRRASTCTTPGCGTRRSRASPPRAAPSGSRSASSASTSARRRACTAPLEKRETVARSQAIVPNGPGGPGEGTGEASSMTTDDTGATFRCPPKRRGRSLDRMTEIADVAAALADRTRARMLEELLGGPPLPAGALAARVGVAPSTVSGHLAKLEQRRADHDRGQRPPARGAARRARRSPRRSRRWRGSAATARGRSASSRSTAARRCARRARATTTSRAAPASRSPTTCSRAARCSNATARSSSRPRRTRTTSSASASTPATLNPRRPLARACTDWTERRPHLAGALGAALLTAMLDQGWLKRRPDGRALNVTARSRLQVVDHARAAVRVGHPDRHAQPVGRRRAGRARSSAIATRRRAAAADPCARPPATRTRARAHLRGHAAERRRRR